MRAATALLCLLIVVGGISGAVGAQEDPANDTVEPELIYDIQIESDGDARWQLRAMFPTDTDARVEAFDELAADFRDDEGETYLSIEPYQVAVATLDENFERSMTIEDENRSVNRSNETGQLIVRFRWTNFARTEGEHIFVGDVFREGEYRWFTRLTERESLVIRPPANYTVESSGAPLVDRVMRLEGPTEVEVSQLSGTFQGPPGGSQSSPGLTAIVGGLLGLAGGAVLVLFLTVFGNPLAGGMFESDEPAGDEERAEEEDRSTDSSAIPDETLLRDEERVLALILAKDGRMKQADIVTETDWSNAKVSQLLTQMAEEGQIEKLRIGRENLIRLPQDETANEDG